MNAGTHDTSRFLSLPAAPRAYFALLLLPPPSAPPPPVSSVVRAAAVIAPLYFFPNSALIACAIALVTKQPFARVWHDNFLWSAPSYLVGAGLAAVATAASARGWTGWLALLAVPLY